MFSMLIISFGLWGIGDMLKLGGRSSEVAHIGGTHIPLYGWLGGTSVSVEEVRQRFNLQLEQIQRQTGSGRSPIRRCATACTFVPSRTWCSAQ
jgi:peptidyl-prolyl cis-trans isomerase D